MAVQKGRLVLLLGPSGSGKDTLLNGLKAHFEGQDTIQFVRRAITRPPSQETEDHLPLDERGFAALEATGHFSVTWQANGLRYALPREALDFVQRGGIAIANGSRQALKETQRVFGSVTVFEIVVEEDVLRQRLLKRGREDGSQVEARLARNREFITAIPEAIKVDNSGSPEDAIRHVAAVIENLMDGRCPA